MIFERYRGRHRASVKPDSRGARCDGGKRTGRWCPRCDPKLYPLLARHRGDIPAISWLIALNDMDPVT